jgi:hypothetical protein
LPRALSLRSSSCARYIPSEVFSISSFQQFFPPILFSLGYCLSKCSK